MTADSPQPVTCRYCGTLLQPATAPGTAWAGPDGLSVCDAPPQPGPRCAGLSPAPRTRPVFQHEPAGASAETMIRAMDDIERLTCAPAPDHDGDGVLAAFEPGAAVPETLLQTAAMLIEHGPRSRGWVMDACTQWGELPAHQRARAFLQAGLMAHAAGLDPDVPALHCDCGSGPHRWAHTFLRSFGRTDGGFAAARRQVSQLLQPVGVRPMSGADQAEALIYLVGLGRTVRPLIAPDGRAR